MEPIYGMHLGMVISDNPDPEGRNRVQVWIPHISNTLYTSINSKITNPDFIIENSNAKTAGILQDGTLNIKDPSDLDAIDREIMKNLRLTLPWAEYAAPLFGGGSSNYNSSTGITSTSSSTTIPETAAPVTPTVPITSPNAAPTGDKPIDTKVINTDITPNPNNVLNPNALPIGLQPYAQAYIDAGKRYNIDPNFLAAISWEETGGGISKAFLQGNNAMGISNSNGPIYGFNSVQDSIFKQAATLSRQNGPYSGATTIKQIGQIYAPSGAGNDFLGTNGGWSSDVSALYSRLTGNSPNNVNVTSNNNSSASGEKSITYPARSSGKMVAGNIGTAGSAVGSFTTPRAGNKVWVFFLGGDPQKPVYFAQAPNAGDIAAAHG